MSDEPMEVDTALDAVKAALDEIQLADTDHDDVTEALDRAETLVRSARDELVRAHEAAIRHEKEASQ